jgi:hypothetical protein
MENSQKELLINNIKTWVQLDNEIKTLQSEMKTRKKNKETLSQQLIETMKSNNIDSFDINNGSLEYKKKTMKKPISKKMLLNVLNNFFEGNQDQSEALQKYIHDNRETTTKENIVLKNS